MNQQKLILKNVRVHNLKSVSLTLDSGQLVVFTGVSGSGKSSLAFDTIYVEGQRRYVESLSSFARRQMGDLQKPDADLIQGISPTIAIEQKTISANPRSTVGTLTEIYDYLRVLYARVATAYCPVSQEAVEAQTEEAIISHILKMEEGKKLLFLAPVAKGQKGEFKDEMALFLQKGFLRVRIDGTLYHLQDPIQLDGHVAHDVELVIDRVMSGQGDFSRIAEATRLALEMGKGTFSLLSLEDKEEKLFSVHAYSPTSGLSYQALQPQDFSFNSPQGMCARCQGLGNVLDFDLERIIEENKSIEEGCFLIGGAYETVKWGNIYRNLAKIHDFSVATPWKKLSAEAKKVLLYGTEKKWTRMRFTHPETGASWSDLVQWRGVLHEARSRFNESKSDSYKSRMEPFLQQQVCPECLGARLKPYPAAAKLGGLTISQLTQLTIEEALSFLEKLNLSAEKRFIASELLKEAKSRLQFLLAVGLNYLTLSRQAPSLSGGEAQRVRLASQIGSQLTGVTYVLDEPSIGLHPRDNEQLIASLKELRDLGNTVIVVEHDEETMQAADYLVDFGPRAGSVGGSIVAQGDFTALCRAKESLTGAYLSRRREIAVQKERLREVKEKLVLKQASLNNLQKVDLTLPLSCFIAVTGVSGSGKSSLISDTLYPALSNLLQASDLRPGPFKELSGVEHIDKVIAIDQSPIGRSPRSNPATYIKLLDEIRDLFASLPESIARGYQKGRFSFNVKEGSCPTCSGMGMLKVDLDFLDDAFVTCPDCKGKRYDSETLSIRFREKNIFDILAMDVQEALEFFAHFPKIRQKLEMLVKVGLDYLKLGQTATTLSGGEAERIKLAKELARPSTGKTLYILDEPTTGLHFEDIFHLLHVLHALVDKGNTVICIEHNMEVVKEADWVIDMGPEGGKGGGSIIFAGEPQKLQELSTPTGKALARLKQPSPIAKKKQKKEKKPLGLEAIEASEVETHNLKKVSATIPHGQITVCTGPSGSGKSSFAFDTIYAEGQRRYTESLSPYARQFIKQSPKPPFKEIKGLKPAIAIEQKSHAGNPRSTVGTLTEIYDYLRLLYARKGVAYCPETGEEIKAISKEMVVEKILALPEGERIYILAPLEIKKEEDFHLKLLSYQRLGFLRVRVGQELFELEETLEAIRKIPYKPKQKQQVALVIDRLKVNERMRARLFEALENSERFAKTVIVQIGDEDLLFNMRFAVPSTGKSYAEITPKTFAFNLEEGMCPECHGIGTTYGAKLGEQQEILEGSLFDFLNRWLPDLFSRQEALFEQLLGKEKIEVNVPLKAMAPKKLAVIFHGSDSYQQIGKLRLKWAGLNQAVTIAAKWGSAEEKEALLPLVETKECPKCQGCRLNPLASHVQLMGKTLKEIVNWPIEQLLAFLEALPLSLSELKFLGEVKEQALNRTRFLAEIGLGYLSLNRSAPTLSGGETQRIRLAKQLGSGLTGCLYVLDEPTIGLHPRDGDLLSRALMKLKNLGNTLLMVEHDPRMLLIADHILDFGPQAGIHGGQIVAQGTYEQIQENPSSLTGAYLKGERAIPLPLKRRESKKRLLIEKASLHNLKEINLSLPVGAITGFTGVSGSGKSTLLHGILKEGYIKASQTGALFNEEPFILKRQETAIAQLTGLFQFKRLIVIDQNPIGHTVRSDVGTYAEVLTHLRPIFASLPQAAARGLQPKHFSYNHRKGMCTHCYGLGYKKIEMHFLPPVKVQCEACQGLRLNPLSLSITYKGLNFGQILQLTVKEAYELFALYPKLAKILKTLSEVGLDYLKLGQEMQSLSGGEAQRIKLSREIAKRSLGKTLYLLDEPTIGLHLDDLQKLVQILNHLADKGNTVVVIEHNVELLKNADYLIELGPFAGKEGGQLIACGTPEELATNPHSATAPYLAPLLTPLPANFKKESKKIKEKRGRAKKGLSS